MSPAPPPGEAAGQGPESLVTAAPCGPAREARADMRPDAGGAADFRTPPVRAVVAPWDAGVGPGAEADPRAAFATRAGGGRPRGPREKVRTAGPVAGARFR